MRSNNFQFNLTDNGTLELGLTSAEGSEIEIVLNERDTARLFVEMLANQQNIITLPLLAKLARNGNLTF